MKLFVTQVLVPMLGWLCFAASASALSTDQPTGVDAVLAYNGTWKGEMEHFDTVHSKAGREKINLRNVCLKNGGYVACNQYVDGDSKILLVFTYNPADKTYTSYQIPQGGGDAGSGKLLIDGNVWTFPWQTTEGDKTTYYHVVNVFTKPDKIEGRQEFSTDKMHWTVMWKATEIRVSTP